MPPRALLCPARLLTVGLLVPALLQSGALGTARAATPAVPPRGVTPSPTAPDQVGDIPGYRPPATLRPQAVTSATHVPPARPATVAGSRWTLRSAVTGGASLTESVPVPAGAVPLLGDWDGDGLATPAVYRGGIWTLYDSVDGGGGTRPFLFGAATDRPVVGDWNHDGATDVGVVRRTSRGLEWILRTAATAGPANVRFLFGGATDRPVTGDWNGDGTTDIGVVRAGTWILRNSPTPGPASARFSFGLASDTPVTGDWAGAGRSGIGIVRNGTAWAIRDTATPGPASARPTYAKGTPLAWPLPRAGAGDRCPTAYVTPDSAAAAVARLVAAPTRAPTGTLPAELTEGQPQQVKAALLSADRYLLTTYRHSLTAGAPSYLDVVATSPVTEWAVRTPAAAAMALAVSLRTGAYDPDATGVSVEDATAFAVQLVGSVACQHDAVSLRGWGDMWQSAYWAYLDGLAGWLLWPELTPPDQAYVARMVEHEADRFVGYAVPYLRRGDGTLVTPGDSKAEENAWNANVLQLATAMMPTHPHRGAWAGKDVELLLSSTARPVDEFDTRRVDGASVSWWLRGSNLEPDGTVVNHDRVHPAYMASVLTLDWSAVGTFTLAGQPVPEAVLHNGDVVWRALQSRVYPTPPFAAPGGTMYRPDSADVYFPEGNDWGTDQVANFAALDGMADVLPLSGVDAANAASYEQLHTQRVLAMQSRSTDGRCYQAQSEDVYYGREQWVAMNLAYSWLTKYALALGPLRVDTTTNYSRLR